MTLSHHRRLAAATLLLAAATAGAQQTSRSNTDTDRYSMLPYTRSGYVGLNLGQTQFDTGCGSGGYVCKDSRVSGQVYTGGLFNDWVGVELGYLNTGKADRAGGRTRAEGVGVSLLLRAPLGSFNAFVKAGGLYGQTKVSAGASTSAPGPPPTASSRAGVVSLGN